MASLGIASLFSFFSEETKSIRKGENHYKSGHVESFVHQQGVLRGEVHASMKKKVYKVTVIVLLLRAKNIPNCSFYDKSMKLGRITNFCETNIS